jgi:hypothetical protein
MKLVVPALALCLSPAAVDDTYVDVDYAKLERALAKEPAYVAAPQYALFLFGPRGDARMWAVLDKSRADLAYYDVLYFDLDCDGDLTEAGERFQGEYDDALAKAGVALLIDVPSFAVPGTELVHTKFRISTITKQKNGGTWFQFRWNGETELSGGYGAVSTSPSRWAPTKAAAPVFRPTPRGPFSFALYGWGADEIALTIGGADKVYVMVGNPGGGPDTLAVVDEEFLDLEEDELLVELVGRDADGHELKTQVRLKEHC